MKPQTRVLSQEHRTSGFTLVEIVVSMTVLLILVLLSTQMFNGTAAVISGNTKHLDADSQARLVLDRMGVDFAGIVIRPDVDYYFQKNPSANVTGPNDQFAFYSQTTGYYPAGVSSSAQGTAEKSNLALVGYRINSSYQLERLSKALVWNGVNATGGASDSDPVSPMVFLPSTLALPSTTTGAAATWPQIAGNGTDQDYQVIGDQVLRLEICFLVRTSPTATATLSDTPYIAPHTTISGLQDVAAVVVSLAVLDPTSRTLLTTANLAAIDDHLADDNGTLLASSPAKLWKADLLSAPQWGLPATAASQIRVYERYFFLPKPQ
jgi:prepilin-type N-terminal cleavage/methylation domain-containing protein